MLQAACTHTLRGCDAPGTANITDARFDDGQLDICIVRDVDKFKLFFLFPTVYFGRHLSIPEVEYFQAQHLRVETEGPLDVYADGEYVCSTPIEVSVAANALRVVVP